MNKIERQKFISYCLQGGRQKKLEKYFKLLEQLGKGNKKYQKIYPADIKYVEQKGGFLFGTFGQRSISSEEIKTDIL